MSACTVVLDSSIGQYWTVVLDSIPPCSALFDLPLLAGERDGRVVDDVEQRAAGAEFGDDADVGNGRADTDVEDNVGVP